MDPYIWGPILWEYLHLLSINYPNDADIQMKKKYENFLLYLGHTLPCDICSKHYLNFMTIEKIKSGLKDKTTFMKLIWELHNDVNKKLNKKYFSYKNFSKKYYNIIKSNKSDIDFKNKTIKNKYSRFILIIIIIFICIVLLKVFIFNIIK